MMGFENGSESTRTEPERQFTLFAIRERFAGRAGALRDAGTGLTAPPSAPRSPGQRRASGFGATRERIRKKAPETAIAARKASQEPWFASAKKAPTNT